MIQGHLQSGELAVLLAQLTGHDELVGPASGLELVFIFRENQVGCLGLGPSVECSDS